MIKMTMSQILNKYVCSQSTYLKVKNAYQKWILPMRIYISDFSVFVIF